MGPLERPTIPPPDRSDDAAKLDAFSPVPAVDTAMDGASRAVDTGAATGGAATGGTPAGTEGASRVVATAGTTGGAPG